MAMNARTAVVGAFDTRDRAEQAVEELRARGFNDDMVGIAMRGAEGTGTMAANAADTGAHAAGGATTGAVIGGILGAAAALLIPGIGPVLAIGTLGGTVLAGAAAGAGLGALAGALVGMGVPEDEAHYYQGEFEQGRAIVTVQAGSRFAETRDILRRFGGYDVEARGQRTGAAPMVSPPVPARPMAAPTTGAARMEGTHRIGEATDKVRLHEEHLNVEKAVIETEGNVPMANQGLAGTSRTMRWEDELPHFRSDWQSRFGSQGGRWDGYEPYYRYGFDQHASRKWLRKSWTEVAPELRRDWEGCNPGKSWDVASDPIKHAWDHLTATPHSHTR